jgi:polyisoprenoid-binding protein YceI
LPQRRKVRAIREQHFSADFIPRKQKNIFWNRSLPPTVIAESQFDLSFKKDGTMTFGLRTFVLASSISLVVIAGCSSAPEKAVSAKAWHVDNSQSNISFVTTKAGQAGVGGVGEIQSFKKFSGGLDSSGQISFDIELASVDTGVEIRDQRLRTMLWNVAASPKATFAAKLDPAAMNGIEANATRDMDIDGSLTMAGQSKPVAAKLRVARIGGGALMVTTRAPIVINANDYGLKAGVEAMREVMGLNFLASSAPVTFTLVLTAKS